MKKRIMRVKKARTFCDMISILVDGFRSLSLLGAMMTFCLFLQSIGLAFQNGWTWGYAFVFDGNVIYYNGMHRVIFDLVALILFIILSITSFKVKIYSK